MSVNAFGEFLCEIRLARGHSIRRLAELLQISPSYYHDMEKGRRNPPDADRLAQLASILGLNADERSRLFDLAGEACGRLAPDLADYLQTHAAARKALRLAWEWRANDQDRAQFIELLRPKYQKDTLKNR